MKRWLTTSFWPPFCVVVPAAVLFGLGIAERSVVAIIAGVAIFAAAEFWVVGNAKRHVASIK